MTEAVSQRIDAVVSLILENDRYLQSKRTGELVNLVMATFNVKSRQAQKYVKGAKQIIAKMGKEKREKAYFKAIRDREFLFQKAKGIKDVKGNWIEKPDYKFALEVVKDRDKLCGLYVDEIKHSGTISVKNIDLSKMSMEQLSILRQKIRNDENIEDYLKSIGML